MTVVQGLEGVVVAETRLSHVDGEKGELIIAGSAVENLAGQRRFEERGQKDLARGPLFLGPQQRGPVEQGGRREAVIIGTPHRAEIAVVRRYTYATALNASRFAPLP